LPPLLSFGSEMFAQTGQAGALSARRRRMRGVS
jgi:hypothetical protein